MSTRTSAVLPPLSPNGWLRWEVVERLLPPGRLDVLEVGCGQGGFGARLAQRYRYVGVEPDAISCAVAAAAGRAGRRRGAQRRPVGGRCRRALRPGGGLRGDRAHRGRRRRAGRLGVAPAARRLAAAVDAGLAEALRAGRRDGRALPALRPAGAARPAGQGAGLTDVELVHFGAPLGYLLEAGRNAVGKRRLGVTRGAGGCRVDGRALRRQRPDPAALDVLDRHRRPARHPAVPQAAARVPRHRPRPGRPRPQAGGADVADVTGHVEDLAAFITACPSSYHAAAETGSSPGGGRLHPARRGGRLGRRRRRARPALRAARRLGDRVGAARGGRPDDAVPHRRRAHRLARLQAQAAADGRRARLAAGRRRGLRRSAAQLVAGPRARAGRPARHPRRRRAPGAHRPVPAHPAAGDPPGPRGQRRSHPGQAAAHHAGVRRRRRVAGRPAGPPRLARRSGRRRRRGLRRPDRRHRGTGPVRAGRRAVRGRPDGQPDLGARRAAGAARHRVRGRRPHQRAGRVRPRGARLGVAVRRVRPDARRRADPDRHRPGRLPRAAAAGVRRVVVRVVGRRPRRAPELPGAARPGEPAGRRRRSVAQAERQPALRHRRGRLQRCGPGPAPRPVSRSRSSCRATTSRAGRRSGR